MRNDGRDNLLGALLIAGQFLIPEVSNQKLQSEATAGTTCRYCVSVDDIIIGLGGQLHFECERAKLTQLVT